MNTKLLYMLLYFRKSQIYRRNKSSKEQFVPLSFQFGHTRTACSKPKEWCIRFATLQWRHNGPDGVSHHQPHDCLLSRLFRRRSKKTSKLRVNRLCEGNSPVTSEFPAQMASNAVNVSIWWRHHDLLNLLWLSGDFTLRGCFTGTRSMIWFL